MSAPSALSGLRIGAVSYLNTKPLIRRCKPADLVLDVPARLADAFFAGTLDVALLPLFEVLRRGAGRVVNNVAIACDGPVYSVLVGSRCPFAECKTIWLDPSSRSSAALLKVLIAEFYPGLRVCEGNAPDGEARLVIGDPAIDFHRRLQEGWQCHDLGALWRERTGLPFVFAVWALSPRVKDATAVAEILRGWKTDGLAQRDAIAAAEPDPAFARDYLTRFIRYDIGAAERSAIELFGQLAARHGLIDRAGALEFV